MGIADSPLCNGMPITIDISLSVGDTMPVCGPELDHDYCWQDNSCNIPTLDITCIEDLINALMGKTCDKKQKSCEQKDVNEQPDEKTHPFPDKKKMSNLEDKPQEKDKEDKDEQRDNT